LPRKRSHGGARWTLPGGHSVSWVSQLGGHSVRKGSRGPWAGCPCPVPHLSLRTQRRRRRRKPQEGGNHAALTSKWFRAHASMMHASDHQSIRFDPRIPDQSRHWEPGPLRPPAAHQPRRAPTTTAAAAAAVLSSASMIHVPIYPLHFTFWFSLYKGSQGGH
jgi:hypothetical protein